MTLNPHNLTLTTLLKLSSQCSKSDLDVVATEVQFHVTNLVGIHLFKVNNRNTRMKCETCSKLTIKTPERRHWCLVNFEQISHIVLGFPLFPLDRYSLPGWESINYNFVIPNDVILLSLPLILTSQSPALIQEVLRFNVFPGGFTISQNTL